MDLWNRCGLQHDFLGRVLEIEHEVYKPEKRKRGAKPKWQGGNALYAWLEVEAELQLARRANPKATALTVMQAKFCSLKGKPLRVVHDMSGRKHLEIANPKTAVRRHSEGKKLLKANPMLAARWKKILDSAIAAETHRFARNLPR